MRPVFIRPFLVLLLFAIAVGYAFAGGGPENVLIVVNARSPESLEIGNAYRRARAIPYRNLVTIATAPTFTISPQAYLDEIETPIRAYLDTRQLAETITCIVLTRGIPQQVAVENGRATASLLAAMRLRGEQPLSTRLPNPYYASAQPIAPRAPEMRGLYLVTTLTGYTTRDVATIIAQGVAGDGTAPPGRFLLLNSPQLRAADQQATADMLTQRGLKAEVLTTPPADGAGLMACLSGGVFSGLTRENVTACTFHPGAIADLVEPFGAAGNNLDENASPLFFPIGALTAAGVTGAHGIMGDAGQMHASSANAQRLLLDRYTGGFSLAESFYSALPSLHAQHLVIGDPLCTPYARRPAVALEADGEVFCGLTPVRISASAPNAGATIRRIDLYLDSQLLQTAYAPAASALAVRIGDVIVRHPVPPNTSLRALVSGLAERINMHPTLQGPGGVRAEPLPEIGALQLIARTPGEDGNQILVGITQDNPDGPATGISAKADVDHLTGGGVSPTPARGAISFLGRRVKVGDLVTVKIGPERFDYTVPEANPTLAGLLDGLVAAINASPTLQKADGVRASRDPQGMPVILLDARAPGERGNKIVLQTTVKPVDGSTLRGVPELPTAFVGGQDGTAAVARLQVVLGEAAVKRTIMLDTGKLADGAHMLRAVAIDGTPLQTQGWCDLAITTANLQTPPTVALPEQLAPASGEMTVPVTVHESVKRVDLYIDGQLLGSADRAPFTIRVPLANLGRGVHDLWAEGVNADRAAYRSAILPLTVLTAPEVTRITPDHTVLAGGTVHRIIGTGFAPNCTVRLAGISAKTVRYLSPNTLEVTADAGQARRGWVEVTNADGTVGTLGNAFEYYAPRVASAQITPAHDIVLPGRTARFSAPCFDQFGHPITATVTWDVDSGTMTQYGVFTAPPIPGPCTIRARHPDSVKGWEAPVTVGPEDVRDGVLRQWLVLGAFPDPDGTGLEKAFIPETTVLPAHGLASLDKSNWRSVYALNAYVDLAAQLVPNTQAVGYAHVYLKAPAACDAKLVFGSDDGIRLWLNGAQIYSVHTYRSADPNQTTLPIHLNDGWNRLLVKVEQGGGPWGFYLRLLATDGKPLPGLLAALDAPQ